MKGEYSNFIKTQKKISFCSLFLYLVFGVIGYLGLSQTFSTNSVKTIYMLILLSGSLILVILTYLLGRQKRAIYLLLLIILQLLPIYFGALAIIAFSLSAITSINQVNILLYLFTYMCCCFGYSLFVHGARVWCNNIKNKKFDIINGCFYPTKNVINKKIDRKSVWMLDLAFLLIVFFLTFFRMDLISFELKFLILFLLSMGLSFFISVFLAKGFIYPLFRILEWEVKNRKTFSLKM